MAKFSKSAMILALALVFSATLARSTFAQSATIKQVMVAQVLGNQMDRFVAGKDAAVLVQLSQPMAVDAATQKVIIKMAGQTVATLEPTPANAPTDILIFLCPNRAACGDWKAGDYTFDANVGDAKATATAKFQERRALSVFAFPIKTNYGPSDVRSTTGAWKNLLDFSKQIYPLAPGQLDIQIGPEVDASDNEFDTRTDEGQRKLALLALRASNQEACFQDPKPTDIKCYDSITGFVKDRLGEKANLQGFAYKIIKTNINVESDADAAATVAHEIGHLYNLGDEYLGGAFNCPLNPPPAGYVGKNFNDPDDKEFSCKDSKSAEAPEGYTGSRIIANTDFPFEIGRRGLLPDMTTFMGNGKSQEGFWISPANWSALFDALDPAKTAALPIKVAAPRAATQSRWVFAWGLIGRDDKVSLMPWYSFMDPHEHKDKIGKAYTLRSVDAQGKTLATDEIKVEFEGLDNKGSSAFGVFEISVPFPESTATFEILKGDKVIHQVKISANAPTVNLLTPKAGEKLADKTFTFKWEAADKDGDKLAYDLEYSIDGDEWFYLAQAITKNEITFDLSDLPGSDKTVARIRVTATDGVNATYVDSELFNVPPRAPLPEIENPANNATFKAGAMVSLMGFAYDYQDEEIYEDDQLVWTSDLQGELGKGEVLNLTNLKPGKHVVTLSATNSFKLSATATITLTITP